jgi:hypothetical protein
MIEKITPGALMRHRESGEAMLVAEVINETLVSVMGHVNDDDPVGSRWAPVLVGVGLGDLQNSPVFWGQFERIA